MSKKNDEPIKTLSGERNTIIRSLTNGEVPERGLRHLVVGRKDEIKALISDLDAIRNGESPFRIINGPYGIGKTFLHRLISSYALEANLVVMYAQLTTEHRFHGRGGRGGKPLYPVLLSNLQTKWSSGSNSVREFIENWICGLEGENKDAPGAGTKAEDLSKVLGPGLGQDFARAIMKYREGCSKDDRDLQEAAMRWLTGGYSAKAEARKALGVERIIEDGDVFNALKVWARFCRVAGYGGLLVIFDELGNLTNRSSNPQAREASLSCILEALNESLQKNRGGFGIIFAGLTEAVTDPEKGLFSSTALRTRLKPAGNGFIPASTLITLSPLRPEETLQLLQNIVHVWAEGAPEKYLLPEEGIRLFLEKYYASAEKNAVITPREVVRPFIEILYRLEEKPEAKWHEVIEAHPMKRLKQ